MLTSRNTFNPSLTGNERAPAKQRVREVWATMNESEFETNQEPESPAEEAMEEDRRRAYRLNKVLGATLTSLSGDSQQARLFVIDISLTGFRATDHQPHSEEFYDISVVLERGKEPFSSRMRVVWTKELTVSGMFQMGCEFVDTSAEELAKLEGFIERERGKVETPKAPLDLGRPWTMIR